MNRIEKKYKLNEITKNAEKNGRPALGYVSVTPGRALATDGKIMASVPAETNGIGERALIHGGAIAKAAGHGWDVDAKAERVTLADGASFPHTPIDGHYPETTEFLAQAKKRAENKSDAEKVTFALNPKLLHRLFQAMGAMEKGDVVEFTVTGPHNEIIVRGLNGEEGLIMPVKFMRGGF